MNTQKTVLLLAAIWMLIFCLPGCDPQPVPEKKPVIRPVVVYEVQDFTEGRTRTFTGSAKAALKTYLSFRVGGKVNRVNVAMGDDVRAGSEIARLDDSDYKTRVQQLEAELARIEAVLTEAKASYERILPLYDKKIVAESVKDTAEAKYESSLAQKNSGVEALKLSRRQLEYTRLKAPIDGDISEVRIEVHQVVNAGQPIAAISSRGELEMEINVPARLISLIRKDDKATIKFDALPEAKYPAVVSEVGVAAGETNAYPVTLKIRNTANRVKPGMVGEAKFMLKATPGDFRVLVPAEAVVGEPGKKYFVWVVAPETNRVSKRPVIVGNLTSDGLQIKKGLQPGALVVTRGVSRMEDGMEVRLLD